MSGLKYKNTIETLKYRLTNIISTQLNYIKEKNIIKAWNDEKLNEYHHQMWAYTIC